MTACLLIRLLEDVATPLGELAACGDSGNSLQQASERGTAVGCIRHQGHPRRPRRVARKICHQTFFQSDAVALPVAVEELYLHSGHVDAGGAFALARLAADAQLHGFTHLLGRECVVAELPREGQTERVGASASDVVLIECDPVRRAHDAPAQLAAGPVVVAHLHCAGEPAPLRPVQDSEFFPVGVLGRIPEQRAVVHAQWAHDLSRVEASIGVETSFYLSEGIHDALAEHGLEEFRADDTVAVLSGM